MLDMRGRSLRTRTVTPEMLLRRLIGAVLRRTRLAQGRTLRDVAAAAKVSMAYLSELERGRKEVSSEILAAICRALHLTLAELLDQVRDELLRLDPPPPAPVRLIRPALPARGQVSKPGRIRPTPTSPSACVTTRSTKPYATASCAVNHRSRSLSRSMVATL